MTLRKLTRLALASGLVLGLVLSVVPASAKDGKKKELKAKLEALPQEYQLWVESVRILISDDELQAFLELEKDYQRDAFIERFWRSRDPYPQTPRNELKERWMSRVEEAKTLFGNLTEDRSRILLLNGIPTARILVNCTELWPAEVWYYQRAENLGSEMALIFYQQGGLGAYRIFYPGAGLTDLIKFPGSDPWSSIQMCRQSDIDALRAAFSLMNRVGSMGFMTMVAELMDTPESPSGEWVSAFNAYSTDMPDDAETFPAKVEIEYPGRHQNRTVTQGVISVDKSDAQVSELSDIGVSYNFLATGEIIRDGRLFDSFRYQYNLPATQLKTETIPLVFERYLRPGEYELALRVDDLNGEKSHRVLLDLDVPRVEHLRPPEPADPETARLLAEANAAITSGDNTIKIVEPRGRYQTGMLRIDTMTTGKDISSVDFILDGHEQLIKRVPPFTVELDLGSLPRMRTLTAVARDAQGVEVARDQKEINAGSHRFDARLVEPRSNRQYERSLRAEAQIEVPDGGAVERVDFYLNETLVSTLYQEPWTQPIFLDSDGELAYVRVVAYRPDGNYVEDTVFVNAPDYMENLEVQFVELYITVLDKAKHPVLGLEQESFTVQEDEAAQEIRRFDRVTNLPIHAAILLDISASMEESLGMAQRAALEFFQENLTPKDRAALMTFNDHPNLAVKFTNELADLAGGLAGLKAERGTALFDSVVFSLFYFNGIKGQRALIILSDGKDEHSQFTYEDTLEYARRAGVAIYSIGLGLNKKSGDAKKKLTHLAEETGGRSFFVDAAEELPGIYSAIQEELRSRYYIAYQSTNTAEDDEFRFIEVEVTGKDLEAKTLRGYYP
ncbi:MAG: VWA domain-containing protein [Thermoanaerobaculia bacterium]|jgi:VWFA-related protein